MTVQLVVKVQRTEVQTVVLDVEAEDGETAENLAYRYDDDITGHLPWDDWDLISAEVRA